MIQTIKKAWGIPELRKKIIFTALILLIFRIGNAIPVPYVNTDLLKSYLEGMSTTVLGLYNVMSGGAFAQATVFALGVQPYINSSIIIQLLTIAIPALERLARDGGEEGKKKIPLRQCLGCREMKPKRELIRVVRSPQGEISLDFHGKKPGRGAYLCPDPACLKRIRKSRALERAFDLPIPDAVYDALAQEMEGGGLDG